MMQRIGFRLGGFAVVCALLAIPVIAGAQTGGRYFISGSPQGLAAARSVAGTVRHEFPNGFSDDLSTGQLKSLEVLGAIFDISVEPVVRYSITKPPGACDPWPSCKNGDDGGGGSDSGREYTPSDQTPWGIERVYGDGSIATTSGGVGVDVAVLDTGVHSGHLDLTRRVEQCVDFTHPKGVFDGKCDDKNGHGTHVAGTVLADGGADGQGVYGVAPGADLFAYKVCGNNGLCWGDDIAMALRTAADRGAEVTSMSLGSDTEDSLIRDAVSYADSHGVLVVAAAGNDGPSDGSIDYPGANVQVVAVGATDSGDTVPSWSSRGVNDGDYVIEAREVEFGAPGVSVESSWNDGSYNTISGTSMATPHVSGMAAKLWQGSASATRTYLQSIAEDVAQSGDDTATGFGIPSVQ